MNNKLDDKNPEIVRADLVSRFKDAYDERNEASFYGKVAYYGDYIRDNPLLREILLLLQSEAKATIRHYVVAYENFYKQWRKLSLNLVKIAEDLGIMDSHDNHLETNHIVAIRDYSKDHPTPCLSDDSRTLYQTYSELADRVEKVDKKMLFREGHLKRYRARDGNTRKYRETLVRVLWEKHTLVPKEWDHISLIKEHTVWWAHYNVERVTNRYYSHSKSARYFLDRNLSNTLYRGWLEGVALMCFEEGKIIRKYLAKLHGYLIPRIEARVDKSSSASKGIVNLKGNALTRLGDIDLGKVRTPPSELPKKDKQTDAIREKLSFKEESDTLTVSFDGKNSVVFDLNQPSGCLASIFLVYCLNKWRGPDLLYMSQPYSSIPGGVKDYDSIVKEKKKNNEPSVYRDIINSITYIRKKIKKSGLSDNLIIQSAAKMIGHRGKGYFRLVLRP